jgi:hypothetical protein
VKKWKVQTIYKCKGWRFTFAYVIIYCHKFYMDLFFPPCCDNTVGFLLQ